MVFKLPRLTPVVSYIQNMQNMKESTLGLVPDLKLPGEWRTVPIIDNGERLVSLGALPGADRILLHPQYFSRGVKGALPEIFVRQRVALMLIEASHLLPQGSRLVIWDGWRPIAVQRALFDDYLSVLQRRHPGLGKDRLKAKVSAFVSFPSEDETCPPPHNTGGAVDLSIVDGDGEYLPMGTDFDSFSTRAQTRYLEGNTSQKGNKACQCMLHRRLLYSIMTKVGFTNYPEEWWHYDFGNQFWAAMSGARAAMYGPCSPDL